MNPERRSHPTAGRTPERLAAFTDAVFAIAITLLVLEIPRPTEDDLQDLGHYLANQFDPFLAFGIAFVMLWGVWRAHHTLLGQMERISQAVLTTHVPLLMFSALLPFSTSLLGEGSDDALPERSQSVAVAMFAANEGVILLCIATLVTLTLTQRLHDAQAVRTHLFNSAAINWAVGLWWLATAAFAFVDPSNSMWLWAATPLVVFATAAVCRRFAKGAADSESKPVAAED